MKKWCRCTLSAVVISVVYGCGGGGSEGSSGGGGSTPSPVSPATVITNASEYSVAEVITAATTMADNAYTGTSAQAQLDIVSVQKAYRWMFDDGFFDIPEFSDSDFEELGNLADAEGRVEGTINCTLGGSIDVNGQISSQGLGNISMTYTECSLFSNDYPLNGTLALAFIASDTTSSEVAIVFNGLSWQDGDTAIVLNGYLNYEESTSPEYSLTTSSYLTATAGDESVKLDTIWREEYQSLAVANEVEGSLFLADKGEIQIALQTDGELPPDWDSGEIEFSGDKHAALEFDDLLIRYIEDTDGDGNFDVGTYFSGLSELVTESAHVKNTVSLDTLTLPPVPSRAPGIDRNWDIDASAAVEVIPQPYDDPDTPYNELTVYYRWYANGIEIENQNGAILPPENVTYGDELQVAMVVSDGGNDITSARSNPAIVGDAPAEVKIDNPPTLAVGGEAISFFAQPYDPDTGVLDIEFVLQSGPDGATLSDDGTVTWQAPTSQMFGEQTYYFQFSFADPDSGDTVTDSVGVTVNTEQPLPLSTGAVNPTSQVVAGDFDHDGRTELLSRHHNSGISLARKEGDYYVPVWAYPYKFPAGDVLKSVTGADVDGDADLEIVVATEEAIMVIDDLTQPATILHESEALIALMTTADFNGDGIIEAAYIVNDRPEDRGGNHLVVVTLQQPAQVLLDMTLDSNDVYAMMAGNVDNDAAVELILDNGYVLDGADWSVQWQHSSDFGYYLQTLTDQESGEPYLFTGNFVGEGSSYSLYSVVEQRLLDTVPLDEPCGAVSVDMDSDGHQEILASHCDELVAYQASEQALQVRWRAQPSSDYYRFSSVATGDLNGDTFPEVIWTRHADIYTIAFDAAGNIAEELIVQNQTHSAKVLGWPAYSPTKTQATFVMALEKANTATRYQLAEFDENGHFNYQSVIDDFANLYFTDNTTALLDSDGNGIDEMLLQLAGGHFSAVEVSSGATVVDVFTNEPITHDWHADTADLNGDGNSDVIYSANRDLWAYDMNTQALLGHVSLDWWFSELVSLGNNEFVGAGRDQVSLGSYADNSLQIVDSLDLMCSRIVPINYDDDAQLEILCLDDWLKEIVVLDSRDGQLSETQRFESMHGAVEIVADPSTPTQQGFFIVSLVEAENFWGVEYSRLSRFSHDDERLWDGPLMLGEPEHYQFVAKLTEPGKVQIQLITDTNMIVLH